MACDGVVGTLPLPLWLLPGCPSGSQIFPLPHEDPSSHLGPTLSPEWSHLETLNLIMSAKILYPKWPAGWAWGQDGRVSQDSPLHPLVAATEEHRRRCRVLGSACSEVLVRRDWSAGERQNAKERLPLPQDAPVQARSKGEKTGVSCSLSGATQPRDQGTLLPPAHSWEPPAALGGWTSQWSPWLSLSGSTPTCSPYSTCNTLPSRCQDQRAADRLSGTKQNRDTGTTVRVAVNSADS